MTAAPATAALVQIFVPRILHIRLPFDTISLPVTCLFLAAFQVSLLNFFRMGLSTGGSGIVKKIM
jgi:hypothetical protein